MEARLVDVDDGPPVHLQSRELPGKFGALALVDFMVADATRVVHRRLDVPDAVPLVHVVERVEADAHAVYLLKFNRARSQREMSPLL